MYQFIKSHIAVESVHFFFFFFFFLTKTKESISIQIIILMIFRRIVSIQACGYWPDPFLKILFCAPAWLQSALRKSNQLSKASR